MRMTLISISTRARLAAEDGFTMMIALGVMFVTSLLLVAAFTAANGDIHLSYTDTTQKQAYYAALAGVQQYEFQLQTNPNYWQTCETPKSSVIEEASEKYEVTLLPASSAPEGAHEMQHGIAVRLDDRVEGHAREHVPDQVDGIRGERPSARSSRPSGCRAS